MSLWHNHSMALPNHICPQVTLWPSECFSSTVSLGFSCVSEQITLANRFVATCQVERPTMPLKCINSSDRYKSAWTCLALVKQQLTAGVSSLQGGVQHWAGSSSGKAVLLCFLSYSSLWSTPTSHRLLIAEPTIKLLCTDGDSDKQVVRDGERSSSCRLVAKVCRGKKTAFAWVIFLGNVHVQGQNERQPILKLLHYCSALQSGTGEQFPSFFLSRFFPP